MFFSAHYALYHMPKAKNNFFEGDHSILHDSREQTRVGFGFSNAKLQIQNPNPNPNPKSWILFPSFESSVVSDLDITMNSVGCLKLAFTCQYVSV